MGVVATAVLYYGIYDKGCTIPINMLIDESDYDHFNDKWLISDPMSGQFQGIGYKISLIDEYDGGECLNINLNEAKSNFEELFKEYPQLKFIKKMNPGIHHIMCYS